jgi:hypothetical protein
MRRSIIQTLAAIVLSGTTVLAGTFTNAFNDPNNTSGFTLAGSGTLADTSSFFPVITDNYLVLTTNQNNLQGSVVLDDLDPGLAIGSFTASFNLLLDSGANTPADGFFFVFGNESPGSTWSEEGPAGINGVTITFDTYNNTDVPQDDAPAIDVKLNGAPYTYVSHQHMAITNLMSPTFTNVTITYKSNGTLSLSYKGQVVFTNLYLNGFVPNPDYVFGLGARTGGLNENAWINDLSITTTEAPATPTAPTITTQPASQSVSEHGSATFDVGFDGTPPFTFQWFSNSVAVADATNSFLMLTNLSSAASGSTFTVGITNDLGGIISTAATLTVTADLDRPTILSVTNSPDLTHLTITFSKPMNTASVETIGNYTIGGLNVTGATQSTNDPAVVVLTTSPQLEGTNYTLTVNNVIDQSTAGNAILPNSQISFTSPVFVLNGAGALLGTNGTSYDVGVSFSLMPNEAAATNIANYTLSAGTITGVSLFTNSPEVVLQATGLSVGSNYTVTISGFSDLVGNAVATTNASFTVSSMKWGVVGADELQLGNGVVAVATNGFDVYSDGIGEWAMYDETTFVYEQVTGDFDKKLRVEYQDASSQWARAGLIARDVTNFGVDRATQEGGAAGRYQKIHVKPSGHGDRNSG